MRHGGKEYGYVTGGRLGVQVGFERYDLGPGDSISFDSSSPHRLWTIGDEPAEAIWVVVGQAERRPRSTPGHKLTPSRNQERSTRADRDQRPRPAHHRDRIVAAPDLVHRQPPRAAVLDGDGRRRLSRAVRRRDQRRCSPTRSSPASTSSRTATTTSTPTSRGGRGSRTRRSGSPGISEYDTETTFGWSYPVGSWLNEIVGGWKYHAVTDKIAPSVPLEFAKIWRVTQARTERPVKFGTIAADLAATRPHGEDRRLRPGQAGSDVGHRRRS